MCSKNFTGSKHETDLWFLYLWNGKLRSINATTKLFFTTLCVCCVPAIPLVHVAQIIMHKLENDLGNSVCYFCDQEIYHVLCSSTSTLVLFS